MSRAAYRTFTDEQTTTGSATPLPRRRNMECAGKLRVGFHRDDGVDGVDGVDNVDGVDGVDIVDGVAESGVCCTCISAKSVIAPLDARQRPHCTRHRDDYKQ